MANISTLNAPFLPSSLSCEELPAIWICIISHRFIGCLCFAGTIYKLLKVKDIIEIETIKPVSLPFFKTTPAQPLAESQWALTRGERHTVQAVPHTGWGGGREGCLSVFYLCAAKKRFSTLACRQHWASSRPSLNYSRNWPTCRAGLKRRIHSSKKPKGTVPGDMAVFWQKRVDFRKKGIPGFLGPTPILPNRQNMHFFFDFNSFLTPLTPQSDPGPELGPKGGP